MLKTNGYRLPNLKLTHEDSSKTLLDKIKKLKERNLLRNLAISHKPFTSIVIKRDHSQDIINYPQLVATRSMRDTEQIAEILRMAKITAYKSREYGLDEEAEKNSFIRDYSNKISQFNLYTKIIQIFNNFQDPNYSEPMFDRDYITGSTSNQYIKSIDDVYTAKSGLEASLRMPDKLTSILNSDTLSYVKKRGKKYEDLAPSTQIERLSEDITNENKKLSVLTERLKELYDTKKDIVEKSKIDPKIKILLPRIDKEFKEINDYRRQVSEKIKERVTQRDEFKQKVSDSKKKLPTLDPIETSGPVSAVNSIPKPSQGSSTPVVEKEAYDSLERFKPKK